MPNSTRISSAIKTIAWPSCRLRFGDLVRIFGTVNRICGDDDVVADNLLDDRSDRLERVPERHLDGLIAHGGCDDVAARAEVGRRGGAQSSARAGGGSVGGFVWQGGGGPGLCG